MTVIHITHVNVTCYFPDIHNSQTKDPVTMTEVSIAQASDSEWPEAWFMSEGECTDQKQPNRCSPNKPATVELLRNLGIAYWKLPPDDFTYPVKSVPWDPKEAPDPKLMAIRDDRGYSYADILTIHPDHLPGYDDKVKSFFEEHIHDAEEIRYIINGSGYFDVRDLEDKWIRIHVKKGDLMTLPEGIYHRFTCDKTDYIHAMRLFIGQPVWTPFNRPQEDHKSRQKFVATYVVDGLKRKIQALEEVVEGLKVKKAKD